MSPLAVAIGTEATTSKAGIEDIEVIKDIRGMGIAIAIMAVMGIAVTQVFI